MNAYEFVRVCICVCISHTRQMMRRLKDRDTNIIFLSTVTIVFGSRIKKTCFLGQNLVALLMKNLGPLK